MKDKIVFGVCSRIANHFGWNVTAVRIIWAVLSCCYGVGVLAYLILAALWWNK